MPKAYDDISGCFASTRPPDLHVPGAPDLCVKLRGLRILLCLGMAALLGCTSAKKDWPPPNWPPDVVSSMWIPKEAKTLSYNPRELYMVTYTVNACYPAKNLIDDMASTMTAKGWERLVYDPLNPSSRRKLNHARSPAGEWGSGLDKDMLEKYDWQEFWKDSQGNIIEYRLEYKLKSGEKIENKCALAGFSMYTSEEQLRDILKAIQNRPIEPPKPPNWR